MVHVRCGPNYEVTPHRSHLTSEAQVGSSLPLQTEYTARNCSAIYSWTLKLGLITGVLDSSRWKRFVPRGSGAKPGVGGSGHPVLVSWTSPSMVDSAIWLFRVRNRHQSVKRMSGYGRARGARGATRFAVPGGPRG